MNEIYEWGRGKFRQNDCRQNHFQQPHTFLKKSLPLPLGRFFWKYQKHVRNSSGLPSIILLKLPLFCVFRVPQYKLSGSPITFIPLPWL